MSMKKEIKRNISILGAILIGVVLYLCIYGVHVLNPMDIDWLIVGGDRSQHYLGWAAYRNSQWFFPIGLTDQLSYPLKTSIIFTDSIPLLAVFFKILSPILPGRFQYFGIWGLITFALNGAFSAKILQKYMKSDFMVILGSSFYILSFQVLQRMFMHTALAGHWLILWAIYLLIYRDQISHRKKLLSWLALGAVSSAIHLYLLLMCGIVLLGFLLVEVIEGRADSILKRFLKSVGYLAGFIGAAAVIIALLGGFSSDMSAVTGGIGAYSLNLNGFINPQWHGRLLRTYSQLDTQYEGFSYLGAGILFMLFCTGIELVVQSNRKSIHEYSPLALGMGVAFGIAFILAVFPTVTFGNRIIKHYFVYPIMMKVWGTFRASGRIAWVCIYLIYLFALCGDYRVVAAKRKSIILMIALSLQLVDISGYIAEKHNLWSTKYIYTPVMDQEAWELLVEDGEAKHIIIMNDFSMDKYRELTVWAMEQRMTVNKFYFARTQEDIGEEQSGISLESDTSSIYVWERESFQPDTGNTMYYYDIDERFVVGYAQSIQGLPAWEEE